MAFQKVMISGIHTSELTVLKEEEKMALLREIQETGSKAARDKLIQGNLRLVLSVIQRFTGRGEDMEDLFQVGVVGLIKAINHFDLSKEVRFSTYCVPMISGELRRYLRDFNQVKVSRSLRDLAYKAMQAKERLTGTLQREPTIEQIATEIGAKREDVVIALESITDPVSLYEPVYSDSGDTLYVMDQISDRDSMENWLGELSIREAMQGLGQPISAILPRQNTNGSCWRNRHLTGTGFPFGKRCSAQNQGSRTIIFSPVGIRDKNRKEPLFLSKSGSCCLFHFYVLSNPYGITMTG